MPVATPARAGASAAMPLRGGSGQCPRPLSVPLARDMAAKEKAARRKLSRLELADDLGRVFKACEAMGLSPRQGRKIRKNFQADGAGG